MLILNLCHMQPMYDMGLTRRGKASWRHHISAIGQGVERWGSVKAGTADITAGTVDSTTGSVNIMAGTVDTTGNTVNITAGTVDISMPATLAKGLGVADDIIPILSWMY